MHRVMALHEILHDTRVKKRDGLVLKLGFEKAYDKILGILCLNALTRNGVIGFKWLWLLGSQQIVKKNYMRGGDMGWFNQDKTCLSEWEIYGCGGW